MVSYSTVIRTKDIKSMVSFIQQSLELRISKNGVFYSTVIRPNDIERHHCVDILISSDC
jgi:hypothetical protein